ncbi:MAG: hypothetical protein M0R46_00345 [Candidatus Muirbacterium halophilum]|nr:hypothetical protein [Candidatus Muirbacterium halophilum]MCK9474342.1 hypothetical protein [Candidatus Muirbacterium halophilum]
MKRFKYKYERLLNLKEIEEKREFALLSRIRSNIEKETQNKNKLKHDVEDLRKKVNELEFFNVEDLRYYSLKNRELENNIVNIENKIEELKQKEIKQNDVVVEIRKNKKILEKLKEKHKIAFFKEEEKQLSKFMDELGTQRFKR